MSLSEMSEHETKTELLLEAHRARERLLRAQRAYSAALLHAAEAGCTRGELSKALGISKASVSRFLSRRQR